MFEEFIIPNDNTLFHIHGAEIPKNIQNVPHQISEMHMHRDYELLIVHSGNMRCVFHEHEFYLSAGDVVFLNSYTPHSTYCESTDEHDIYIQFKPVYNYDSNLRYVIRYINTNDAPYHLFKKGTPENDEIIQYTNMILKEFINKKSYWNHYINGYISLIMLTLRRHGIISDNIYTKTSDFEKILPVLEYINNNYTEELSLPMLSELLGFNETYFCRVFKRCVGTSVVNYINFVRVCKAEHLLKKNMSLSDVAYKTGFSSLTYFDRVFKKFNHYSPGEYRMISKKIY